MGNRCFGISSRYRLGGSNCERYTGDIWLVSYFHAFYFRCAERHADIAQQLAAVPSSQEMPRWKFIEAVAVDTANNVWITSEGSPTPMGRLPTADSQRRDREAPAGR